MKIIIFTLLVALTTYWITVVTMPVPPEPPELECPANTRITIIDGTKKTCLVEHINSYSKRPGIYVSAK
jgi:hypothetical protein